MYNHPPLVINGMYLKTKYTNYSLKPLFSYALTTSLNSKVLFLETIVRVLQYSLANRRITAR